MRRLRYSGALITALSLIILFLTAVAAAGETVMVFDAATMASSSRRRPGPDPGNAR